MPSKAPKSVAAQAGLHFPAGGRMRRYLRRSTGKGMRIGATASVYVAAVLEYVCAEMAELAGLGARDAKTKRITPRHVALAIHKDDEMSKMCSHATVAFAGNGRGPYIHAALLKGPKKAKAGKEKGAASE